MKKMNNKGFALVETLIVAVFVMGILTLLYTNIVPMMGEYEKRENYDNVNNVYKNYLIKKMIQSYSSLNCSSNNIVKIYDKTTGSTNCNQFSGDSKYCSKLMDNLNVLKVYITKYKNFTNTISDNDPEVKEYAKTLGTYNSKSTTCNCRIIVKYEVNVDVEQRQSDGSVIIKKKNQFATIGVKK